MRGCFRAGSTPASGIIEARALDVLVVDDEDRVRDITCKILESGGHRVRPAKNGRQALELLAEGPCDVLLSDVIMPHMGGPELVEAVLARYPTTLVAFTSGAPLDVPLDGARVAFLAKPFERQSLLDQVQKLAEEHRSTRERVSSRTASSA